eukprot:scaffold1086_cov397-Prasinococcus_capsulatus_cf.AAC.16
MVDIGTVSTKDGRDGVSDLHAMPGQPQDVLNNSSRKPGTGLGWEGTLTSGHVQEVSPEQRSGYQ